MESRPYIIWPPKRRTYLSSLDKISNQVLRTIHVPIDILFFGTVVAVAGVSRSIDYNEDLRNDAGVAPYHALGVVSEKRETDRQRPLQTNG